MRSSRTLELEGSDLRTQEALADVLSQLRNLGSSLEVETRKRSEADDELNRTSRNNRELVEREATERQTAVDGMARQLQQAVSSFEQERRSRDAAETELRQRVSGVQQELQQESRQHSTSLQELGRTVQTVQEATVKEMRLEKERRTDEVAAVRHATEMLESQCSQKIADVKLRLDAEVSERTLGQERLQQVGDELRRAMETEARSRVETATALERGLKDMSQVVEKELRVKSEEISHTTSNLSQLRERLEMEGKDRSKVESELQQRLSTMAEGLSSEQRRREQREADTGRQLQEVATGLAQEQAARQQGDEASKMQLQALQDSLAAQASARSGDEAALRRSLQALEAKTSQDLQASQQQFAEQLREVAAAASRLEATGKDTERGLSSERTERANETTDLKRYMQSLQQALEAEAKSRSEEQRRVASVLEHLQGRLEAEGRERSRETTLLSEKVASLGKALEEEKRARADGDVQAAQAVPQIREAAEKERLAREAADAGLKEQLSAFHREVTIFKGAMETLESQLQAQSKEAALGLETELGARVAGEERIEAQLREMLRGVDARTEEEQRQRVAESGELAKGMQALAEGLAAEERARLAGDEAATQSATLAREMAERGLAEQSTSLQDLASSLERERLEREQGDGSCQSQIDDQRQALGVERTERVDQAATLQGGLEESLRALEAQAKELEAERGQRVALAEHLEKYCEELRRGLESEAQARGEREAQAEREQQRLDEALMKEGRDREAGDAQCLTSLQGLQEALQQQLTSLRDDLGLESAQRSAGADGLTQQFQELTAKFDKECEERERLGSNFTSQLSTWREELEVSLTTALKDLRQELDQEAKDRGAADTRQEEQHRDLLSRLSVESESRTKEVEGLGQLLSDMGSRQDGLQATVTTNAKAVEELQSALPELRKALEEEVRGAVLSEVTCRAQGDNDLSERVAKQQEEQRNAGIRFEQALEQLDQRLEGQQQALEAEKVERERGDAEGRQQAAQTSQELKAECSDRADADAALQRALRELQGQLEVQTTSLEAEIVQRKSLGEALDQRIQDICDSFEAVRDAVRQAQDKADGDDREIRAEIAELHRRFRACEDLVARDAQDRAAGVEERRRIVEQARLQAEQEQQERIAADGALDARLRELSAALGQERSDREQSDADLNTLAQGLSREVTAVREEGQAEGNKTRRGWQDAASSIGQEIRDLKSALEGEASQRAAGEDRLLERVSKELGAGLSAESAARAQLAAATQRDAKGLQEGLEQEQRKREADGKAFGQQLKTEAAERKASDEQMVKHMNSQLEHVEKTFQTLHNSLGSEAAARERGDEELLRGLKAEVQQLQAQLGPLVSQLEIEVRARQQGDQAEAETRRKMFEEEVRLRERGDESAGGAVAADVRHLDSELQNIRSALDHEVRARVAAESADSDAWKQALSEEARLRVKGDESTARNLGMQVQQAETLIGGLRDGLGAHIQSMQARLSDEQRALKEEVRMRQAGDQANTDQVAAMHQALQAEGEQRATELKGVQESLQHFERLVEDRMSRVDAVAAAARDSVVAVDIQVKEVGAGVRSELATVDQALQREVQQRIQGDAGLQDLVAGKADKAEVDRERDRAERHEADLKYEDAAVRKLVDTFKDQLLKVRTIIEESFRGGWKEEARRLWEAIDTHTHDFNLDAFSEQDTIKSSSPPRVPTVVSHAHKASSVPATGTTPATPAQTLSATTVLQYEAKPPPTIQRLLQQRQASPSPLPSNIVEYIAHPAGQVPHIEDMHLRVMQPHHLREHASSLYRLLGPNRIGDPVPLYDEELLEWIINVQRVHVTPLRLNAASTLPSIPTTALPRNLSPEARPAAGGSTTLSATMPAHFMFRTPAVAARPTSPMGPGGTGPISVDRNVTPPQQIRVTHPRSPQS